MKLKRTFYFSIAFIALFLGACNGGNDKAARAEEEARQLEEFQKDQPLENGLYNATYFDIKKGEEQKKGHFDGRIYFALSPKISAIRVFENGNRTKIDYHLAMPTPFEKTDSGTFVTTDSQGRRVTLIPDSVYLLQFSKGNDTVCISFDPKPRSTGDYMTILEKINEAKNP